MSVLISKLAHYQQLFRNAGWLMGVELLAKVSRVLTIIVLATCLTPVEYGTAMLAVACHEVIKLLLKSGTGSQIVQCSEQALPKIAGNGLLLQWVMCIALCAFQIAVAFPIGQFYGNPDVTVLLIAMAFVYLFYPLVSVKVFLLQRANKLRGFSLRNGVCILMENLSIAAFAWFGAGVFSLAWGKWVFALTWVAVFIGLPVRTYPLVFHWDTFSYLMRSCTQLIFTELSRALRLHLDVLVAGRLLTPELFGLYSFAKSAGVGLTNSVSQAFVSALYPHLCEQNRQGAGAKSLLMTYALAAAVGAVFCVQALAVPLYVPILFGERWEDSLTTTAVLCVLALPAVLIDVRCTHLRAKAEFGREMFVRLFCVVASAACLLLIQPNTPSDFAKVLLMSSLVWAVCLVPFHHLKQGVLRVFWSSPLPLFNRK